jgi:pimeloyl-ACP methyl ester carboxylesterase
MFTEETLTLSSGRTQLVHRGGEGPPLVWLHSLYGFDPEDPILRTLVEHYAVFAPVAPGMTDLQEIADVPAVHDLALHYDDILNAAGLDAVPVVGHSFGAMMAAELAAHVPERVSQLVLLSPIGLWDDDEPVADLFAVPYTEVSELLFANPSRSNLRAMESADGERDVEAVVALAQAMTTVAKYLWPIPDRGLCRRLHRISAPALVVFGEEDAFVPPSYGERFARLMPDARSEVVAGAGHMVHFEQPEAVRELVGSFLGTTALVGSQASGAR